MTTAWTSVFGTGICEGGLYELIDLTEIEEEQPRSIDLRPISIVISAEERQRADDRLALDRLAAENEKLKKLVVQKDNIVECVSDSRKRLHRRCRRLKKAIRRMKRQQDRFVRKMQKLVSETEKTLAEFRVHGDLQGQERPPIWEAQLTLTWN